MGSSNRLSLYSRNVQASEVDELTIRSMFGGKRSICQVCMSVCSIFLELIEADEDWHTKHQLAIDYLAGMMVDVWDVRVMRLVVVVVVGMDWKCNAAWLSLPMIDLALFMVSSPRQKSMLQVAGDCFLVQLIFDWIFRFEFDKECCQTGQCIRWKNTQLRWIFLIFFIMIRSESVWLSLYICLCEDALTKSCITWNRIMGCLQTGHGSIFRDRSVEIGSHSSRISLLSISCLTTTDGYRSGQRSFKIRPNAAPHRRNDQNRCETSPNSVQCGQRQRSRWWKCHGWSSPPFSFNIRRTIKSRWISIRHSPILTYCVIFMWSAASMHYIAVRRFPWTFMQLLLYFINGTYHMQLGTELRYALFASHTVIARGSLRLADVRR